MASQVPTAEMEPPTSSDTPPASCGSTPATAAPPDPLEAEIEASIHSDHTTLDNIAEPTGHAAEKNTGTSIKNTEKEDHNTVTKQLESNNEDDKENPRDLDMLADTVRSIVTDVEVSATGDQEIQEVSDTNASNQVEEIEAARASETEKFGSSSTVMDNSELESSKVVQEVGVVASGIAEGSDEVLSTATRSAPEEPKRKRQKRCEYSDEIRALCVRRHQTDGASYAMISKEMGIPHDTVRAIVRKAKRTGTVTSAPRSGRPRKTSGIVDKVILEAVKANKQCSAKSIQEELLRVFGVKISPETVRRRVLDHTKQRILSISSGALSESAGIDENDRASASVVAKYSGTQRSSESTASTTSFADPASFQELLHGEALRASGALNSAASAIGSVRDSVEHEDESGNDSTLLCTPTVNDAVAPECPSPVQSPDPEGQASAKKRPKRGEYSIETREQCVALHAQGQGYRKIGKSLNMPHTTVRAIVEKAQRTGSVLPSRRSGRPRKTDEIVDKVILQAVKANEKSSARVIKEQLLAAYGVRVSCETIRRRVKDHNRQCMLVASSTATPHPVADVLSNQNQVPPDHGLLAVAIPDTSSVSAASLMTYDENGVHI